MNASSFARQMITDLGIKLFVITALLVTALGSASAQNLIEQPSTSNQTDHTGPLAVDPTLSYSTYFGFNGDDSMNGIAVDASGNSYVTGSIMVGASGTCTSDNEDVIVLKFDPTGKQLLYGARIGGCRQDIGNSIVVDGDGNVYVTGLTRSDDFPVSSNAYAKTLSNSPDAFLIKLNTNVAPEQSLVYSTYFNATEGKGIDIDSTRNVYITGQTYWGMPTTTGSFRPTCSSCSWDSDAFVAKFDLSKSGKASLVYST